MRKTIPVQPDGSIHIPKDVAEEVFGKTREAVVHIRSGCLVLSPVFVDIESGQLPQILALLHRFESLDTVLNHHFHKASGQAVQFEGDLSVLSLNDVFLFLSASKKSGSLVVQDKVRWGFFFQNGNLAFAASDEPKASLAAYLLKRQFVTEEDLVQATKDLGRVDALKVLLDISGLTQAEFTEQRLRCVEDTIFHVFTLGRGRFSFINGEVQRPFDLTLPMSTTNYVMEATRRIDEWAHIKDRVPEPETLLEMAEDVTASTALSFEEEQVLSQVNGHRTMEEVLSRAKAGDMEGKKAVASLIAAGLVRAAKPEAPQSVPSAPSAALSSEERAGLLSRIDSYNNVFSTIYQALAVEAGSKVDVVLGAFFKGLEPGTSLLSGTGFSQEGTLPRELLLSRLAELPEGREATLVRDLNELLYFQLFAVKNALGPEMEAGIVEMARSLLHV